jgi:hypothetical protein
VPPRAASSAATSMQQQQQHRKQHTHAVLLVVLLAATCCCAADTASAAASPAAPPSSAAAADEWEASLVTEAVDLSAAHTNEQLEDTKGMESLLHWAIGESTPAARSPGHPVSCARTRHTTTHRHHHAEHSDPGALAQQAEAARREELIKDWKERKQRVQEVSARVCAVCSHGCCGRSRVERAAACSKHAHLTATACPALVAAASPPPTRVQLSDIVSQQPTETQLMQVWWVGGAAGRGRCAPEATAQGPCHMACVCPRPCTRTRATAPPLTPNRRTT